MQSLPCISNRPILQSRIQFGQQAENSNVVTKQRGGFEIVAQSYSMALSSHDQGSDWGGGLSTILFSFSFKQLKESSRQLCSLRGASLKIGP